MRACVRACGCFLSHEWTGRVFPRESSFTSLRKKTKKTRGIGGGRAGRRRRWMGLEGGGGVLRGSVSPSLTPHPARKGTAMKSACVRLNDISHWTLKA